MTDLCGLYAIADTKLIPEDQLRNKVEQAISGGASLVQYRNKGTDTRRRKREAAGLRDLCREKEVLFLVNDDVELALAISADGVHLGNDDTSLQTARSVLGRECVIGISCYNQWQLAVTASENGADYIAFGRFFPSRSKPEAILADQQLLRDARLQLSVPVVAIGGITPDNGRQLIEAGADMLAVIHGLFGQAEVFAAAKKYERLFNCG